MSLESLLSQTVTILHQIVSAEDEYGATVKTWGNPTTHRGRLSSQTPREITDGRDTLIADWVLYLLPDASITGRDRVTVNGVTFQVIGPPALLETPVQSSHIKANLRAVND